MNLDSGDSRIMNWRGGYIPCLLGAGSFTPMQCSKGVQFFNLFCWQKIQGIPVYIDSPKQFKR